MSSTTPIDNRAETAKKWVEVFNGFATLLYKIAAAVGAVITLLYLFSIDFFPQGLTPGEVIFFVFVALAFGFLYLVLLLYGAYSSVWIVQTITFGLRLFRYRTTDASGEAISQPPPIVATGEDRNGHWQRTIDWVCAHVRAFRSWATRGAIQKTSPLPKVFREPLLIVGSCFVFFSMALTALVIGFAPVYELLLAFLLGGFVFLGLLPNDLNKNQINPTWLRWIVATCVPLMIVIMFAKPAPLLHLVFQGLGIRVMQTTIEVPVSETATLERISELIERPIIDCRKTSEGRLLVHGADVLWNGIGNQALVSFTVPLKKSRGLFEPEKAPEKQATIRLDASQVHILRTKPPISPCFDLSTDMLFKTASFDISDDAQQRLEQLATAIKALGTPSELLVRGHSDPRPISNELAISVGDNQRLSERRAETVAKLLRNNFSLAEKKVRSEGVGSREPKVKCPVSQRLTGYEAEQCNRPNRRVEVKIKLAQAPAETKDSNNSSHQ